MPAKEKELSTAPTLAAMDSGAEGISRAAAVDVDKTRLDDSTLEERYEVRKVLGRRSA